MPKNNPVIDVLFEIAMFPVNKVPYPVFHNFEKALTLKKVFWHLALEGLEGGYFEFGVASGNSISSARHAIKSSKLRRLGIKNVRRPIHGFDTFANFQTSDDSDTHATWAGDRFSFDHKGVKNRFSKHPQVVLHPINAEELALPEVAKRINQSIGDEKCAVAMFDMDLGSPTYHALNFIAPRLQPGSVLIFDEYFAYLGDPLKGESGALQRFLSERPGTLLRELSHYGDGGRAFQVHQVPTAQN